MRLRFLLFLTLTSFFSRAAESPGKAAIAFAEGLRDGMEKEKLMALCALNPDTGDRKKDLITENWKTNGKRMLPLAFRVVEEKIGGENAAVVLSQLDENQGGSSHVLSLAIVKRGREWLAAPVLSSFQNSIVTYDPTTLSQRQELEHWMLAREIFLREEMQTNATQKLQEKMRLSIAPESLKSIAPRDLLEGLILAIRERDQAATLARLGGFSSDSIPQWDAIVQRISTAFRSDDLQQWPWKLIASNQALLAIGAPLDLGDEKSIDMLALHPESLSEEPDFFSFSIQYDEEGRARVVIPDVFLQRNLSEDEMGEIMDSEDPDQLAMYESIHKQSLRGWADVDLTNAKAVADTIEKSLQNNDFATFWGAGAAPATKADLLEMPGMVGLWQKLQGSATGSSLFGRVGFLEQENHALLVLQSYAPRNTDAIQLQQIWLVRNNQKWVMLADAPDAPPAALIQWWDDNKKAWSANLADALVANAVRIGGLAQEQPNAAEVRKVFTGWLQAVQEKSLTKVIPFCAAFQDERSINAMMRALAGELMYGTGRYEVLDVNVNGRWAAVSAKVLSDKSKSTPQFPLYVFVVTEKGPRLLPQVELKLALSNNRSRNYLNNLAFTELKKYLPDAAVNELQKLYEKHESLVNQQLLIKP